MLYRQSAHLHYLWFTLACLGVTGHGRSLQTFGDPVTGRVSKEWRASQEAENAVAADSLLGKLKQSEFNSHARTPVILQILAKLLLHVRKPSSGWRVGARSFSLCMGCCSGDHSRLPSATTTRLNCFAPTPDVGRGRTNAPIASAEHDSPQLETRWMKVDESLDDVEPREGAMVMPIFTDPGTHFPGTSMVLEIMEPRYIDMYNDIIYNGARRFVSVRTDFDNGRIAEVGTIFHIDELQEVPSDLEGWVEYIGKHSAIARVKVLKVLNPQANYTLDTYMRAEVEELQDSDADDDDTSAAEAELHKHLSELVDMQVKLEEDPLFSDERTTNFPLGRKTSSDERDLWDTILLWQRFIEKRRTKYQRVFERTVASEIQKYLVSDTIDAEAKQAMRDWISSAEETGNMAVYEIPDDELHDKLVEFQQDLMQELRDMQSHPYGPQFQPLLQSNSHSEQLSIFRHIIDKEHKRLSTRMMLKSVLPSDA